MNKKEVENWYQNVVLPFLESNNVIPVRQPIIRNKTNPWYVLTAIVIGLILGGAIVGATFYAVDKEAFKSVINHEVNLEPNIQVDSPVEVVNNYDHKIDNMNNNSFYINNFIECP